MKAAQKRACYEKAKLIHHWLACAERSHPERLAEAKAKLGVTCLLAEVITSGWADPNGMTLSLLEEGCEPVRRIMAGQPPLTDYPATDMDGKPYHPNIDAIEQYAKDILTGQWKEVTGTLTDGMECPLCTSNHGTGQVYVCHALDCPVHGERNRGEV